MVCEDDNILIQGPYGNTRNGGIAFVDAPAQPPLPSQVATINWQVGPVRVGQSLALAVPICLLLMPPSGDITLKLQAWEDEGGFCCKRPTYKHHQHDAPPTYIFRIV